MTAKEVIRLLEQKEWVEVRQTGSHKIFKNSSVRNNISVPIHSGKDIRKGTLKEILKEANIRF